VKCSSPDELCATTSQIDSLRQNLEHFTRLRFEMVFLYCMIKVMLSCSLLMHLVQRQPTCCNEEGIRLKVRLLLVWWTRGEENVIEIRDH